MWRTVVCEHHMGPRPCHIISKPQLSWLSQNVPILEILFKSRQETEFSIMRYKNTPRLKNFNLFISKLFIHQDDKICSYIARRD